jgi:hypothetical protein
MIPLQRKVIVVSKSLALECIYLAKEGYFWYGSTRGNPGEEWRNPYGVLYRDVNDSSKITWTFMPNDASEKEFLFFDRLPTVGIDIPDKNGKFEYLRD